MSHWALRKFVMRGMHFRNIGVLFVSGAEPFTKGCLGLWFPGPAQRGGRHARKGVHAAARHGSPRRCVPADPRCPAAQAGQYWHFWVRWVWPQHHTSADRLLWEQRRENMTLTLGAFLLFFKWEWFRVKPFQSVHLCSGCPKTFPRLPETHSSQVWLCYSEKVLQGGQLLSGAQSLLNPKDSCCSHNGNISWNAWRTDKCRALSTILRKPNSLGSVPERPLHSFPLPTIGTFSSTCGWERRLVKHNPDIPKFQNFLKTWAKKSVATLRVLLVYLEIQT